MADDEQTTGGRAGRRRRPRDLAKHRQLAEEVAGAEVAEVLAVAIDADVPSRIDEELLSRGALLGRPRGPLADHLVGQPADLLAGSRRSSAARSGTFESISASGPSLRSPPPVASRAVTRSRRGSIRVGVAAGRWRAASAPRKHGLAILPRMPRPRASAESGRRRRSGRRSRTPTIARLTVAWFAVNAGKWAFLVTTLVIAYEAGGTVAVGSPRPGPLSHTDPRSRRSPASAVRWPPEAVLRTVNIARTVAVGLRPWSSRIGRSDQFLSSSSLSRPASAPSPGRSTWRSCRPSRGHPPSSSRRTSRRARPKDSARSSGRRWRGLLLVVSGPWRHRRRRRDLRRGRCRIARARIVAGRRALGWSAQAVLGQTPRPVSAPWPRSRDRGSSSSGSGCRPSSAAC